MVSTQVDKIQLQSVMKLHFLQSQCFLKITHSPHNHLQKDFNMILLPILQSKQLFGDQQGIELNLKD